MKMKPATWILLLIATVAVVAGCATTHVDWNARVGTFTYDQAVTELGPPDKTAKLTDGQTVDEWISRHQSGGVSTGIGTGFFNGSSAMGLGVSSGTPNYHESRLRLTFTTNNVLSAWSKD